MSIGGMDMAQIIWGNELATKLRNHMKQEILQLQTEGKRIPQLVVILVGDHPASVSYVKGKAKACNEIGMLNQLIHFSKDITEEELCDKIQQLNQDDTVDGILVQLPLPDHICTKKITSLILPEKDVDGFHPVNIAKLQTKEDGLFPCTPLGVMEMLKEINYDVKGKHVVVVGRSDLVGKPLSMLLLHADATVTICHSKTTDLVSITKTADVLVAAVGQLGLIGKEHIKKDAVVIDVGVNRGEDNKLHGDVRFEEVLDQASYITPVPKGVGPMTITMLLSNTLKAYKKRGM